MSLIKCPECNQEISDKSEVCIHCGYPIKREGIKEYVINNKKYNFSFMLDKDLKKVEKIKKVQKLCNCALNEAMSITHEIYQQYNIIDEVYKCADKANIPHCPTCGSINVQKITGSERAMSVIGLGIFSKKINKTFKCSDCKHTW